jgi:cation transport ATPase
LRPVDAGERLSPARFGWPDRQPCVREAHPDVPDVSRLPALLGLAGAARVVIRQNLVVAALVMLVAVTLALVGVLPLSLGVVVHEGSTLVVVANGLRLLAHRD